jgi:hypothetical protein
VTSRTGGCRIGRALGADQVSPKGQRAGERRVAPLRLPDHDALPEVAGAAATELLLRFVRRSRPSFSLTAANAQAVSELCRTLDGILALLEAVAEAFLLFEPETLLACLRPDHYEMMADIAPDFVMTAQQVIRVLDPDTLWTAACLCTLPGEWSVAEAADLLSQPRLPFAAASGWSWTWEWSGQSVHRLMCDFVCWSWCARSPGEPVPGPPVKRRV